MNGAVQKTMLVPLWGRAQASRLYPEILADRQAIEIVDKLDYDFSAIAGVFNAFGGMGHLVRARAMDDAVRTYVNRHPSAAVVDIGAGLDTGFSRVNNGILRWFDLDLPDALALRNTVIPKSGQTRQIASSVFHTAWFDEIEFTTEAGAIFLAAGVFFFLP